jgi:hypothetical protein
MEREENLEQPHQTLQYTPLLFESNDRQPPPSELVEDKDSHFRL